ncbi:MULTISPECIES: class I SAM-dependent methyltransferase [Legionella]|uniref:Class I SAM-dependent methyltransferase n=1 Tax=Legionella resiliens TaxID=2905958 RepID=A0ABS8X446_9GAMM|nr:MULTISPECIES: methyltransferase domain-containing protein [unclassified Legionella]MCE0723575.1 class I SAM-dependent methyltransferase [Legionella sp. 9fVS26]MCE3532729.1 class I SAM-dependent methyltransferase [Legionella sp. 8cVS16]QLZ68864.1 methyltransferase domain-containing protein [Legionella sp. PC1000]
MPTTTNNNNHDPSQENSNFMPMDEVSKKAPVLTSTPQQIIQSNQIIKLLKFKSRQKEAEKAFLYAFADIEKQAVLDFITTLQDLPLETPDTEAAALIHKWYLSVGMQYKKEFAMTDKEYQHYKSANIARIITSHFSPQQKEKLKGKALLDVGAGDCVMTYLVSQHLEMEGNAIDIQTEIDWGGETSSDQKRKNHYMAQLHNYYVYDGSDLVSAVKGKKFAVVMYNHSLHHFPSFQAQLNSLKQASQILEPGGVLFLSEHANCFDEDILDLSHILLNLRYSIDKNQIPTPSDAKMAILKFKAEYQSLYFSKNILDRITQQLGFTLMREEVRSPTDVAKATFFCFVKKPSRAELTYSPYFFDEDKASRLHHVKDSDHQDLPQRRYSAESFN